MNMCVENAVSTAPEWHIVDIGDGAQIEYISVGDGPVLFMLHGVGGNAGVWRRQFRDLGRVRRIIAWNAPGYGHSTPFSKSTPTLDDYANAGAALLNALNVSTADVLGHSMGGLIASRLAFLHVDLVRKLILADCSSGHASYDAAKREAILKMRLASKNEEDPAAYAKRRAPSLICPEAGPALIAEVIDELAKLKQPGFSQASQMVSNSDIFGSLGRLAVSTHVLCGEQDGVTPLRLNQRIADAADAGTVSAIPDAGHWSFIEQPELFNRFVYEFLHL